MDDNSLSPGRRRSGEIMRTLIQVLADAPDGLHHTEVLETVENRFELTPHENAEYPNRPGVRRFPKMCRFLTINPMKAGWMTKTQGIWAVTDAGRRALDSISDPGEFRQESSRLYRLWQTEQTSEKSPGEVQVTGWEEFTYWARYIFENPQFDEAERQYKLDISEKLQEVRSELLSEADDWIGLLQNVFRSGQNLVSHYVHRPFLEWAHAYPTEAATALRELWADGHTGIVQRIRVFLENVPVDVLRGSGTRLNIAAFLAMGMDATKNPPYRVTPFRRLFKACGYEESVSDGDEADNYGAALNFLDTMIEEGIERDLELRDRLDAQSIAWSFFDTSGFFEKFVPDDEIESFHAYKLRAGLSTKKSIDELIQDAESEQVGDAFRQLVNAADSVEGVFPRPYIRAVMFTPEEHHGRCLGAVWIVKGKGLEIGFSPTTLYKYFPSLKPDQLKEYLGQEVESGTWVRALVTPEHWGEQIKPFLALFDHLGGRSTSLPEPIQAPTMDELMDELVAETLWSETRLRSIFAAAQKGPVILSGPPGTSKTWVAQRLAKCLAGGDDDRVRMVQFHPSYGYEEFMEGLRPEVDDNAMLTFKVRPGVVRQMVDGIGREGSEYHVLVIDEMNRANLPRVLGELMYLFEYRDAAIDLQYTPDFTLPPQLLFIATMNTADRSTQSLDIALRRRFEIFECLPDASILQRFYEQPGNTNEVEDLVDGFEKLNHELDDRLLRHLTIGHSYFMEKVMTRQRLREVWERQLKPLIEEYFLDQPDLADEFHIEKFWSSNE